MIIKEQRFEMHSVIRTVIGKTEDFSLEINNIKEKLLHNKAYTTSPVVYRRDSDAREIELLFQVSCEDIKMVANEFEVFENLVFERCLFVRFIRENEELVEIEDRIDKYARQNDIKVEEPLLVLIPIPGGTVVDVYWPIKEK